MTVDPSVVPGVLFLVAELTALAGVGYVIVRTALRETDHRVALAQGLVVGPAIWGVVVNMVMYALPGMAGALAGWIVLLALAAVLVWRAPQPVRPQLRTAAVFVVAAGALFWIGVASRQVITILDPDTHIGLAASIRGGAFPPELPWNPGSPAPYHYGAYMLNGLLAPPSGPDLAFTEELLSAYTWICLALVVLTALLRRARGFAVAIAAPLLVTAGASTLVFVDPASILQMPVPAGFPEPGVRASLTEVYWPSMHLRHRVPPDIWSPSFTLSYALVLVVLAQAARAGRRSWSGMLTLGALIGFLGLTSSTLTPIALVLWAGLEAVHLARSRLAGSQLRSDLIRSGAAFALAALLLVAAGWARSIVDDAAQSGLSLGWNEHLGRWRLLGTLDRLPGGVGLVGLGPLAVAAAAVLLARRDRLVLALAAGTGLLLLAALPLRYEPFPLDLTRIEGHARNFALFALVLALGFRLAGLRNTRLRYAVIAALAAIVVWPTVAAPLRNIGLAVGNGIELANAQPSQRTPSRHFELRYSLAPRPSDRIADYIRNHTAVDTRVFSPHPHQMTYATGRPNASGFVGLVHLFAVEGPEYRDVRAYLEPAAVRRLGFEYVHAPDSWVEGLPDEAVGRLNDPRFFELLVRDESESLYRVLPAFLTYEASPAPGSYEALRQAVPASATVFLSSISELEPSSEAAQPLMSAAAVRERRLILARAAGALSHTRLHGLIDPTTVHLRTPWQAEQLGGHVPELVVMPLDLARWMFPPASRRPVWWNEEAAVYALDGTMDPIMPPPPPAARLPFSVRLSEVRVTDRRVVFTATFDDDARGRWSGQDWVVMATEAPPWGLPTLLLADGAPAVDMWFAGQLGLDSGTTSLAYEFDFLTPSLAVRSETGSMTRLDSSGQVSGPGNWMLTVRLRHEYQPRLWRDVAVIPVLRITVSETGEVSYQVHEDAGG